MSTKKSSGGYSLVRSQSELYRRNTHKILAPLRVSGFELMGGIGDWMIRTGKDALVLVFDDATLEMSEDECWEGSGWRREGKRR